MEAHRIKEPLFNGRVAVYEAGHGKTRAILLVHGIGADGARVRELRVLSPIITIDDSHLGGGKTGLFVRGSTVVMTGGRIEAEVAISTYASRLDLAAVEVD